MTKNSSGLLRIFSSILDHFNTCAQNHNLIIKNYVFKFFLYSLKIKLVRFVSIINFFLDIYS